MGRVIPNQNSYIAFLTSIANGNLQPTQAEISGGVNLTSYVVSINASTRGNIVTTPDFSTLFETNIPGTVSSTFEADFYRDTTDTAWTTLPRTTAGYFVISRFGGSGTNYMPQTGQTVEVWPVTVVARAMQNLASNTAQQFTVTCAVPKTPNEAAVVL